MRVFFSLACIKPNYTTHSEAVNLTICHKHCKDVLRCLLVSLITLNSENIISKDNPCVCAGV